MPSPISPAVVCVADEERAKVLKNLALTIGRIRDLSHHSLQLGQACDVLRHFLDAVDAGSSCMPFDWLENCSEKAEDLCYAGVHSAAGTPSGALKALRSSQPKSCRVA